MVDLNVDFDRKRWKRLVAVNTAATMFLLCFYTRGSHIDRPLRPVWKLARVTAKARLSMLRDYRRRFRQSPEGRALHKKHMEAAFATERKLIHAVLSSIYASLDDESQCAEDINEIPDEVIWAEMQDLDLYRGVKKPVAPVVKRPTINFKF